MVKRKIKVKFWCAFGREAKYFLYIAQLGPIQMGAMKLREKD
jgi:hypothetical protein